MAPLMHPFASAVETSAKRDSGQADGRNNPFHRHPSKNPRNNAVNQRQFPRAAVSPRRPSNRVCPDGLLVAAAFFGLALCRSFRRSPLEGDGC
jgi:hypothetical protein